MKKHLTWVGVLLILTITFSTIYTVGQQVLRTSANDPQIQLAEDAATQLNNGSNPIDVVTGNVDMSGSLAPFVNIYNSQGQPVAGNGYLAGTLAEPPIGILQASTGHLYNAV